jgi:hypothetical protein
MPNLIESKMRALVDELKWTKEKVREMEDK